MPRNNPVEIVDDEVVTIARRYRVESVATLIAVCRDDEASASARAAAASKLLEYSDGKPGVAKTITRADMASLPEELKRDLFDWLLLYFTGQGLEPLLEDLLGPPDAQASSGQPHTRRLVRGPPPTKIKPIRKTKNDQAVPNRFTRGEPKTPPPWHPPGWGQGGYARPIPARPPEGLKADLPTPTAAPADQAPVAPPQGGSSDGDPRLKPSSPSLLPQYGLASDLPAEMTVYDAYGNPTVRWRH